MAKERSELAVIAALAPVCADKFRALPDSEAKNVALSKVDSWKRRDEFPKELVTLPGESYPSSALVDACSTLLLAPKSAALKRDNRPERRFLRRSTSQAVRRLGPPQSALCDRGPLLRMQPCLLIGLFILIARAAARL